MSAVDRCTDRVSDPLVLIDDNDSTGAGFLRYRLHSRFSWRLLPYAGPETLLFQTPELFDMILIDVARAISWTALAEWRYKVFRTALELGDRDRHDEEAKQERSADPNSHLL